MPAISLTLKYRIIEIYNHPQSVMMFSQNKETKLNGHGANNIVYTVEFMAIQVIFNTL
jgi:hypothetical protein